MLTSSREIIARLEREGFRLVSVAGSHHKYRNSGNQRIAIVPHPRRDLPIGTVKNIYRQAGWSRD